MNVVGRSIDTKAEESYLRWLIAIELGAWGSFPNDLRYFVRVSLSDDWSTRAIGTAYNYVQYSIVPYGVNVCGYFSMCSSKRGTSRASKLPKV